MWSYNYSTELYHYGVPGMKWGMRKAKIQAKSDAYRNAANNTKNPVKAAKLNVKADKFENQANSLDTYRGKIAYRAKKGAKVTAGLLAAGLGACFISGIVYGAGQHTGYNKGFEKAKSEFGSIKSLKAKRKEAVRNVKALKSLGGYSYGSQLKSAKQKYK